MVHRHYHGFRLPEEASQPNLFAFHAYSLYANDCMIHCALEQSSTIIRYLASNIVETPFAGSYLLIESIALGQCGGDEIMRDYQPYARPVPRIGLLITSIDAFNPQAKDLAEKAARDYFDKLKTSGCIDAGSLIRGRVMGPHEARQVADEFAAALVDLVVIVNVAFPSGHVFVSLASHPHLRGVPIAVAADPEPAGAEWAANAWCGVIMNNHAARQMGRPIAALPGPVGAPLFDSHFQRLLRVAGTMKFLRNDFLCRVGDAPGGFHSATGDQLAFAVTFGTRVDTVDLTCVMEAYRTGKATGHLGGATFSDDDVRATAGEVCGGRQVDVKEDMLRRGVRMYHAFRAVLRAGGYTSASFRCWPESNEPYIGVSSCLAMGLLLAHGDVTAAACEGDWPTAVMQSIGTLLSGSPAVCLDWVNYTGQRDVVQLGHCGMGLCGRMAKGRDAIGPHPVLRQAGREMGPVHLGQLEYGPKTGICLTRDGGRFKMLAFTGRSSPQTDQRMIYGAADVRVPPYRELNDLILSHGFPHHLALAKGDILEDLRMLCAYLGVDFLCPGDGNDVNRVRP
jgi:L-fucose isomerase-like protein